MQITYRIPSKKVPYGYVELVDSDATMPQPDELAQWYANFIKEYQAAEVAAFEQPVKVVKPKAVPEDDINDLAANEIKSQLGATEVPWDKTDETPTTSKPWEDKHTEPSAMDDTDWDF